MDDVTAALREVVERFGRDAVLAAAGPVLCAYAEDESVRLVDRPGGGEGPEATVIATVVAPRYSVLVDGDLLSCNEHDLVPKIASR